MALNQTQLLIEQSIFKLISNVMVAEQFWPAYDALTYPNTPTGLAAWNTAVAAIRTAKGFATQPFGSGAPASKYEKQIPRIVIITRRFNPGDIGNPVDPLAIQNPTNPDSYMEIVRPQESQDMQVEIHVVADTAKQERIANAIIYAALGSKGYVPFYGQEGLFFLRQFNYYDIPDPQDSLIEKVFCYEAKDLYFKNNTVTTPTVPLLNEINIETLLGKSQTPLNLTSLPPTITPEGSIIIDLAGIHFEDFI